ncbi:hypothetical protein [Streptomyces sp. NPDC020965]|uniref:hypothetical protein n=1 Tax=Streptomyces sp. NPDC020965 TaxID=3365105 RepID=UPI00379ED112
MPDYPHLGWDPAPGSPPAVAALRTRLRASAEALGTAHRLIDRLTAESHHWHGEAADAFRTALDDETATCLRAAHRSTARAASALGRWHDDLVSHQSTARHYDTLAHEALTTLSHAEPHATHLRSLPDPPARELHRATETVREARESLAGVRRLARELEETHRAAAGKVAEGLRWAERLAPEEPGLLDKVLEWVDEDLGDVLSDVSAGAGFLALILGASCPPLGLALLFIGTGASIGALALHTADPHLRRSLKEGLTKGEFNAGFWDSVVTLTGDALGSVPGVASIAHGAKSASTAVHAATAAGESGAVAMTHVGYAGFTQGAKSAMDDMRHVENPLTEWALRSTPEGVKSTVKYGFPTAGAATAASHYTPLNDDETYTSGATGVDGARAVLDDGPSSAAKLSQAWASLTR